MMLHSSMYSHKYLVKSQPRPNWAKVRSTYRARRCRRMCLEKKPAWIMVGAPAPHAFQVLSVPIYIEITALPVLARPVVLFPSSPLCCFSIRGSCPWSSAVIRSLPLSSPSPVLVAARHSNGNLEARQTDTARDVYSASRGYNFRSRSSTQHVRLPRSSRPLPSRCAIRGSVSRSAHLQLPQPGRALHQLLLADQGPHTRRSRRPHPSVPSLPLLQVLVFLPHRVAHSELTSTSYSLPSRHHP